jgi:hypothetical protein
MDGALSFVVAEARHYSADNPELEGETEAEAQADAALLADIEAGIYSDLDTYAQTHAEPGIGSGESGIGAVFDDGDGEAMDPLPPLQADEIADDEVGAFAAESGDAEAIAVSDDNDATDANPDTPSKQNQEAAADV